MGDPGPEQFHGQEIMKSLLIFSILVLLLTEITGCSCKKFQPISSDYPSSPAATSSLWKLRIQRHDTTLFSGLIALHPDQNGMKVILLDPTGITLLSGRLQNKRLRIDSTLIPSRYRLLPKLLAKSLSAFFSSPQKRPSQPQPEGCPLLWMQRIHQHNQVITRRRLGPFTLWQTLIIYAKKENQQPDLMQWQNTLPAVTLSMQRLEGALKGHKNNE